MLFLSYSLYLSAWVVELCLTCDQGTNLHNVTISIMWYDYVTVFISFSTFLCQATEDMRRGHIPSAAWQRSRNIMYALEEVNLAGCWSVHVIQYHLPAKAKRWYWFMPVEDMYSRHSWVVEPFGLGTLPAPAYVICVHAFTREESARKGSVHLK